MSVTELPALVSEAQAYEKYGHVLQDNELRRARQQRIIGYYKRKSRILYREDELLSYIEAAIDRSYVPCLNFRKSSASENIGSPPSPDQATSTVVGMTPELERLASDHLRQPFTKKPKSGSRPSSSRKAKLRLVTQEK